MHVNRLVLQLKAILGMLPYATIDRGDVSSFPVVSVVPPSSIIAHTQLPRSSMSHLGSSSAVVGGTTFSSSSEAVAAILRIGMPTTSSGSISGNAATEVGIPINLHICQVCSERTQFKKNILFARNVSRM